MKQTFTQSGEFAAANAAEQWCSDNGYSVGAAQRGDPRAIMRGDMDIAKWRNLSAAQQIKCDGVMTGDPRVGPVTVEIFDAEGA